MSVWAIMRVKDEADVIGQVVTRTLEHVDHVLVADNGSTDGTREILADLPVDLLDDSEVGYYQSKAMSKLADHARRAGATWIVPIDADEVWQPHSGRIADLLRSLPDEALIAEAHLYDHVATAGDAGDDPISAMTWRRPEAVPLRKVALRALSGMVVHQGNHGASYRDVPHPLTVTKQLQIHHFPYRSADQMIRKARNGAAAYAATDLPESAGQHWRDYGRLTDAQIREVFQTYFFSDDPADDGLVHDPL